MPLIKVDQFGPAFHVKLKGRQGSTANQQGVDINKDIVAITTTRQLNSPAGAWAITLISRRDSGGRTWAQRIRPMDYVEIRFGRYDIQTRNKHDGSGDTSNLPIVMRGFVDRITETINIDQNGAPFRQTTVVGKDMGKLLLIRQLYILPEVGQEGLETASMQQRFHDLGVFPDIWAKLVQTGGSDPYISPQEFLDRIKKLVYDNTDATSSKGQQTGGSGTNLVEGVPDLKFTTKDMDGLYVAPGTIQTFTGPVWNLIANFQGAPVCELFIEDTDDGPQLVWRWAPFKDKSGKVIDPVKDAGQSTELSLEEIMQYSVSTSDANVYTYYYVFPQQAQYAGIPFRLAAQTTGNAGQGVSGGEGDNPVVRSELAKRYGFKPWELQFPLMKDLPDLTEKDLNNLKTEWQKIGSKVAKWMDKSFSHSVNLEEGQMVLRGNEKLKIGQYIKFKETREEFYVENVRHDFIVGDQPRFTTTVGLTRGLWSDPSPYPDDEGEAGLGNTNPTTSGNIPDPGGEGGGEIGQFNGLIR